MIPKGLNSLNSSNQGNKIPSIKESTEHIKKILMECNFMRTRSKKLENGALGKEITASLNSNRYANSALGYQKNQKTNSCKVYNTTQSRHSSLA